MENISFCRDYNPVLGCQHEELRTVVNLSQKDCGEHFARLSAVDDFVALKWKVRYQMGFPVEFCSAMSTAVWTKGPKICSAKKGDAMWNNAVMYVEDACKRHLCHLAKSGEWNTFKLFKWASPKKNLLGIAITSGTISFTTRPKALKRYSNFNAGTDPNPMVT